MCLINKLTATHWTISPSAKTGKRQHQDERLVLCVERPRGCCPPAMT
jgi:hypothetical protein